MLLVDMTVETPTLLMGVMVLAVVVVGLVRMALTHLPQQRVVLEVQVLMFLLSSVKP
jgi:hypothetical protein